MKTFRISGIPRAGWSWLRDHLADVGWKVPHGGGLHHSWAELRKTDLLIPVEYDRWSGGDITFDAARWPDVVVDLPEEFRLACAKDAPTAGTA